MNRIILILAGLLLTSACATQQPDMTDAETRASLQCEYALTDNDYNYDALYMQTGLPAFDEERNPNGLSGRGYVAYHACMHGKGYDISEGASK